MARRIARACAGATLAFSRTSSDSACIDIDDTPRKKRGVKRTARDMLVEINAFRDRRKRCKQVVFWVLGDRAHSPAGV